MPVAVFPLGPLQTNSHIMHNNVAAVIIDVGGEPEPMISYLTMHKLELTAICLTHRHFDHAYGVHALAKATGAPVYVCAADDVLMNTESAQGGIWGFPLVEPFDSLPIAPGTIDFGGMQCEALATPGHTPGGISLYFPQEKLVFSGDALFYRSIGRTDFPGGDHATLIKSVTEVLFRLPDETVVYPGHGTTTTIGEERIGNPFCGEFSS